MAIDADADFNQAGQICSLIGGRLIQTKNQFENIVAGSQLFDVLAGKSTFIGIRRINGTWSYADGTPLTFQKWKSANETNQVGFDCAMMQGNDFSWYSTKCELKWPFICTFPDGRDGNCPNGWKFYQRTSSCYWTPAQGAHLVSIHSDQENRFVLNLVASVRQNQNVQNCDRKPFNQVLIGLNGTGTEHWTDGSAFDYDHRNSGAYTYGFVNDPLCYQDELSLSTLLLAIISAKYCPPGSIDYSDGKECVMVIDARADYATSQRLCGLMGGRLIQAQNQFENLVAGSQALDVLSGHAALIGVIQLNGTWMYGDGTPLKYSKWKTPNEPTLPGQNCAYMQGNDFAWYSTKCQLKWPFICTISDQSDLRCPTGWSFYQGTGYCYYTPGYGAHLASIHSATENRFVLNLLQTARENQGVALCGSDSSMSILIGLNGTGNYHHWTDGTPFDYDRRNSGGYTYGIENDPLCYNERWLNWDKDSVYGSYVCKKMAV
ncbi:unnamed protein product, partial [Mesorhabditis spiculigera]